MDIKGVLIGLLIAVSIAGPAIGFSFYNHFTEEEERCNTYCNCSISDDCNFTFDYNEVKDCECEK